MNIEVLKEQIGEDILNIVESIELGREPENRLLLKRDLKKAYIRLTVMDLYEVTLKENNKEVDKQEMLFMDLRAYLENFFNVSLKQAIQNGDKQREAEITEKAESGEPIRVM